MNGRQDVHRPSRIFQIYFTGRKSTLFKSYLYCKVQVVQDLCNLSTFWNKNKPFFRNYLKVASTRSGITAFFWHSTGVFIFHKIPKLPSLSNRTQFITSELKGHYRRILGAQIMPLYSPTTRSLCRTIYVVPLLTTYDPVMVTPRFAQGSRKSHVWNI